MAIFNSYVKLPEGNNNHGKFLRLSRCPLASSRVEARSFLVFQGDVMQLARCDEFPLRDSGFPWWIGSMYGKPIVNPI
jgi:hypothetical protein